MATLIIQPPQAPILALSECLYAKLRFTDTEVLAQPRRKAQIQFQFPSGATNNYVAGAIFTIAGVNFTYQTTGASNINTIAFASPATGATVAAAINTALNANPYFQGRITTTTITIGGGLIVEYTIVFNDYEVLQNFYSAPFTIITANTFNAIGYEVKDGYRILWDLYETGTNAKLNVNSHVSTLYRNTQTGFFESDIFLSELISQELTSNVSPYCLDPYIVPVKDTLHNRRFYLKYQIIQSSLSDCAATYNETGVTVNFNVASAYLDTTGQANLNPYAYNSILTNSIKFLTLMPMISRGAYDEVDFCFCIGSCVNMSLILNVKTFFLSSSPNSTPYYYYLRTEFDKNGVIQNTVYLLITPQEDGTFIIPASPPTNAYGGGAYYEIRIYADILGTGVSTWITNRTRFYYDNCDCKTEVYFLNRLGSVDTLQFNKFVDIKGGAEIAEISTQALCNTGIEQKLVKTGDISYKVNAKKRYRFSTDVAKRHIAYYSEIASSPVVMAKDMNGIKRRFTITSQSFDVVSALEYGEGQESVPFAIEGYFNDNDLIANY